MTRASKRRGRGKRKPEGSGVPAGLKSLDPGGSRSSITGLHIGARVRNYFMTGLLIVGPVTITLYIIWTVINIIDAWMKPLLPASYWPESYLPFPVPGVGLLFAIAGLTLVGALAANLLGRTLISAGDLMLDGMPIVRNVYRALKQIFESVVSATEAEDRFQKVGLIQFPSRGLWSLVFVTNEVAGEIGAHKPGGEDDLLSVFMPTGVVPPTGFICFVPRNDVTLLEMSAEEAAKIIISGGLVMPAYQEELTDLAEEAVRRHDAEVADLTKLPKKK